LIDNLTIPYKIKESPVERVGLKEVDTSLLRLQKNSKQNLSIYERSNRKIKEAEQRIRIRKRINYSLVNDLANKFNVDEFKQEEFR
jgi:hypothetical protein